MADQRKTLLKLDGVSKAYQEGEREHLVLRDLDFTMDEGEFIVLIGRSGSGKSTLLNLISGMDQPTRGRITLGDQVLSEASERDRTLFRRKHLGFVFQSFNLIPTLTVGENIKLPMALNGRDEAAMDERVHSLLQEVGLADRANSFPDRLSGGEQQRVAIARALAHDPLLLLADEPTGNLDYKTALQVLDLIERLVHGKGKSMIVVTHDRDLLKLADRVVTLQEGQLHEKADEHQLH